MKIRKRLTAAAVTATTSLGIALTGAAVPAPAGAVQRPAPVATDYGFQATAYGTRVTSEAGLESGRSALSDLSCTRLAGRTDTETLAGLATPAEDPYISADAVDSSTRTYRNRTDGIDGAVTGTNQIARVQLGNSTTPRLVIKGLRTRSTAWATLSGRFRTANEIYSQRVRLLGVGEDVPPGPLADLIGAAEGGIDEVVAVIQENGNKIEIPGLGVVSFGFDRQVTRRTFAAASSFVLRVQLYGADQAAGGGDDSLVGIGRSWARINRDVPAAVMGGVGFGADADFLGGAASVGKLGEQPLPCRGTDGEILQAPTAGLDLASAGQLVAEGLTGRAFGTQSTSGAARAWTEGSVTNLQLGPLEIRGIVGRAGLRQDRNGEIVQRSFKGSSIGEILVDGESQGAFDPSTAKDIPPIEVPGVASIEFFERTRGHRSLVINTVVITVLPDTPGPSVIRLGNAQVRLRHS